MDDFISIDDWKPSEQKRQFRNPSDWRKNQNMISCSDKLSHDDVKKIKKYLKMGVTESSIMDIFNISKLIIHKIKKGIDVVIVDILYISPTQQKLDLINEDIKSGVIDEEIIIKYKLSELTFYRIKKGKYKPPQVYVNKSYAINVE